MTLSASIITCSFVRPLYSTLRIRSVASSADWLICSVRVATVRAWPITIAMNAAIFVLTEIVRTIGYESAPAARIAVRMIAIVKVAIIVGVFRSSDLCTHLANQVCYVGDAPPRVAHR